MQTHTEADIPADRLGPLADLLAEIVPRADSYVEFLRSPESFLEARGLACLKAHVPALLDQPIPQRARRLDTAIILLTERCPLNCLHCSVSASSSRRRTLSRPQVTRLIAELVTMGVRVIKFTGGEPLTVPWITDMAVQALEAGVFVELETAATLLTARHLDALDGWQDTTRFAVGLDSLDRSVYEWFRNTPGAYERVMGGLELLRDRGFPVKIMTVLSKATCPGVFGLIEWTWETFGDRGFHRLLPMVAPAGRGKQTSSAMTLPIPELHAFLYERYFPFYRRHRSRGVPRMNVGLSLALVPFDVAMYPRCGCGTQKLGVTPGGLIGLCHLIEGHPFAISGSIAEGMSLQHAWEHTKPFQRMRGLSRHDFRGVCRQCRFFRICLGGCPLDSAEAYGDPCRGDLLCQSFADAGLFPNDSLY